MKTCLLIVNRPFKSDFDSLYGQVIHLKDKYDKVIVMHPYKTEKVLEAIPIHVDESISFFDKIMDEVVPKKHATWHDFYMSLDYDLGHIDDVWFFGGSMSEGSYLKRKWPWCLDKHLDKYQYMNYISVAKLYTTQYIALWVANKYDAQIYELCYDPGEFSMSLVEDERIKPKKDVIVYHGYDIPSLGIKRLDSFQEYLQTTTTTFTFDTYDFVFGYSYMTKEREATHNTIQELYNSIDDKYDKLLFVKNKIEDHNSFLSREEYMRYIQASRFTLIMPAYEKDCFSIYRLLESVYHDCVPLIHESCNIKDVSESYGFNLERLIVNKDSINTLLGMPDSEHEALLMYLKEQLNL